MSTGRTVGFTLAITALTLLASLPGASAHAAPNPLENEVHVLADEGEDAFYWYDGYDLYHVHVREAYWPPLDQDGLIFRFTLYGGFAEVPTVDELHIDLAATVAGNETVLRMTTTDDKNWTGQLTPVYLDVTEDEAPFLGVTARIQAFAPYSAFGAAPGDTVESIRMVSLAGDEPRDVAPGGIYVPGSMGAAEVPMESQRLVDALELGGPSGYMDVTTTQAGDGVTIRIENILGTGQHVGVRPGQAPGWNTSVLGGTAASLEPGDVATFSFNMSVDPGAREPLPLEVFSDLGGHRWYFLGVDGTELQLASAPDAVDVSPEQPAPDESPGLSVLTALALTGLGALAARRHRR